MAYCWGKEYKYKTSANIHPLSQPDEQDAGIKRLRRELKIMWPERVILKSYQHVQPEPAMSYQAIEENRGTGAVTTLYPALPSSPIWSD
ncbi:MAG: hypothetical protein SNJ59_02530 [Aggregatilineales bacterium]